MTQPISIAFTFNDQTATSILNWEEYHFTSDFLQPCDAFTMTIGEKNLDDTLRNLFSAAQGSQFYSTASILFGGQNGLNVVAAGVLSGLGVTLKLQYPNSTGPNDTYSLMVGTVEQIEIDNSRDGTFYHVRGRNILAPLCDSGIDPWSSTFKFVEGQKLMDVVAKSLLNFGISAIWLTDAKNRIVTTGNNPETSTLTTRVSEIFVGETYNDDGTVNDATSISKIITEYIDPTNNYDLSEKDIKKLQPKHDQTHMQFVEEHLARFHLHCWAMNDGSGVVIGTPDYTSNAYLKQSLTNKLNGIGNNVLRSRVAIDYFSQPSLIIAKGKQGGDDFANSVVKTARINEFLGYDANQNIIPSVTKTLKNFKGLVPIPITTLGSNLVTNYAKYFQQPDVPRVVYIKQEDTATQHELEGFVNRKMAEFQKNALVLYITVQDHVAPNGIPWKHNTIVDVVDETLAITGQWWVQTVSFHKSRSAGTTTDLVLIPVGTLQL